MCFMKESKYDQAARCMQSRIMTKVVDSVLSIDTFQKKCVVLKDMFQSPRLKYHVQTIGIQPSLSNNSIYEHKCLENIKKLYKQSGKCDNKKNSKILLRLLWFLLLKDSPTTVLYLPVHHHQSRNQVLENNFVRLLTF